MLNNAAPVRSEVSWRYPLILVAATVIAFAYLALAEFSSLDDPYNLYRNPRLNPPTLQSIGYYWAHAEYGLYIPLTYNVWGVLALIGRVSPDPQGITLNPWVFHSANIAIHVFSVLLVFAILDQLVGNRRAACIGALLFGLHPIQVEPVAWAAGLKDVLSGMLALLALWQYLRYARCPGSRFHYVLAIAAFILAMLAKPSTLVVPIIAFAIDYWLSRRPLRTIAFSLGPWAALALVCAIVGKLAQPGTGLEAAPLGTRPLIAGDALAFYLYKLVWPAQLAIDYGRRWQVIDDRWWFYVTWTVPALLGIWLIKSRQRRPELLVAGFIFVAGVLPVLGLVTFLYQFFSTTADHYVYLAMLGPALAAAWVVHRFDKPAVVAVAWLVVALLGVRTILQTRVWQNDLSLFSHALDVNPDSFMALNNLGQAHLLRRDYDKAEALLRRAIASYPEQKYWEARQNLANVLRATGRPDEAIAERKEAARILLTRPGELKGDPVVVLNEVASDLIAAERLGEARTYLETAWTMRPGDPFTQSNLQELEAREKQAATRPSTRQ